MAYIPSWQTEYAVAVKPTVNNRIEQYYCQKSDRSTTLQTKVPMSHTQMIFDTLEFCKSIYKSHTVIFCTKLTILEWNFSSQGCLIWRTQQRLYWVRFKPLFPPDASPGRHDISSQSAPRRPTAPPKRLLMGAPAWNNIVRNITILTRFLK